ncbi:MAG: aminoglycoside adenylyltransferase domain-containing protein, partial [Pseudonocardiales bacterium]
DVARTRNNAGRPGPEDRRQTMAWGQRYAVATLARVLYTLKTAEVTSKSTALLWAEKALDPAWHSLLRSAREERSRGYDPADRSRPGTVEQTREFARYAIGLAESAGAATGW